MPGPQPVPISVSPRQRAVLERLLRQSSCPQACARRISIILAAAAGERNDPLAARLGCTPNTIRRWRTRWALAQADLEVVDTDEHQLRALIAEVLADAPRPGAPAVFTAEQIVQIINLACTPPAEAGRPVDAWTPRELAAEAEKRQIVTSISPRSVGRFLKTGRSEAPPEPLLAQRQNQDRGSSGLR
jgi:putative transposase